MSVARKRMSVEERREQLVELGIRIFSEHAYDGISTDEIAREAGVSKGLLYHYFPGKRSFYVAVIRELAGRIDKATEPPGDRPLNHALALALDGFVGYVADNAAVYRTLMGGGIGFDPEVFSIVEAVRKNNVERLARRLPGGAEPQVRTALRGWVGFVEVATLHWLDHRDLSAADLKRILIRAFDPVLAEAAAFPFGERTQSETNDGGAS